MDESSEIQIRRGSIIKQEKGSFGQQIRRAFWPTLGETRISETFPDSYRSITLDKEKQPFKVGNCANFLDKEGKSSIHVEVNLDGQLRFASSPLDQSHLSLSEGWGAGFGLAYDNEGQLKTCALQAESVQTPQGEEPKSLSEKIKILINLTKTIPEDASFISMDGYVDTSRARIQDRYDLPDDVIDRTVENAKRDLPKLLGLSIDPDDINILNDLMLFEELTYRLLEDPTRRINKLLDDLVDEWISHVIGSSAKSYQRSLVLTGIEEHAFDWQEVDREFEELSEDRKVLKEGKQSYGNYISIEGNKFMVTKDEGELSVTCKNQKGEVRWLGRFPISIPSQQIIGVLNDPKADFRVIKDMLGMSLVFT